MNKDIQVGKAFIHPILSSNGYTTAQSLYIVVGVKENRVNVRRVNCLDQASWNTDCKEELVMKGFKLFDLWLEKEGLI